MKAQQWSRFMAFLTSSTTKICLQYGASECHGLLGCYLSSIDDTPLPIGYPLPGVRCLLIDEQGHVINSANNEDTVGEIHVGG